MTAYVTVDVLYTIHRFMHILAAGETARRARVGSMQVHAAHLNLRDLPSIIPNHPAHAQHSPCTMHGPISLVTVCGSALLAQVAMRAVGGTALHQFSQLAGQLWQPRAASLGGRSRRLLGGSGRAEDVPRRVAPLCTCAGVVSRFT